MLANIIICAVLAGIVFLIVRKIINDKKAGNLCSGCSCQSCPHSAVYNTEKLNINTNKNNNLTHKYKKNML